MYSVGTQFLLTTSFASMLDAKTWGNMQISPRICSGEDIEAILYTIVDFCFWVGLWTLKRMILETRNSTCNSTPTSAKCLMVCCSRDLFVCLHIGKGFHWSSDLITFCALSSFLSIENVQEKDFSQRPSYGPVSLTMLKLAVAIWRSLH